MKHAIFTLLCGLTLNMSASYMCAQEQLFINELMPSNINGIMDDRYDFPDSWVEIYNAGNTDIDIQGWYLSNDKKDLQQWQIPIRCVVPAKGYKLLYLDKEEKNLHANFRLDIKGESLYLTQPDGETVIDQSPKFDKLAPNNAYGRTKDGTDNWGWFPTPTPASSNNTSLAVEATQIAPTVTFSQAGGVYDSPLLISIAAKQEEDFQQSIYYTTDGSEPTLESFHYTQPIAIDTTTILRAKVLVDGYLSQPSQVASYLFPERDLTLPVISLVLDPDYLWDDMIGMYTDGKNGAYYYKQDRYVNWAQEWRRPVNVEYFVENDEKINQLGEMRIMGGFSREKPQKSLAVYANKRFGTKRFDYAFFQEKEPLDDGYKSIILRNSGQDFNRSFLRDAVNQYFVGGKVDIDYQAYQPAIVFMNGVYWGIHNIRERSNDDFVASNYDTEDIDMLENFEEIKAGDDQHFNEFYRLVTSKKFTFEELESYLDIEESLNFFILETFIANRDWPHNNNVCWRKRDGGKWRWIIKDTDYSTDFGSTSHFDALDYVNNGNKTLNNIIKGCWNNETFRELFIDRFTVYLGDIFHKDVTIALVDSFAQQIDEEMKIARPRWDLTYDYWQTNIKNMRNWLRVRPNYVYQHLQNRFDLAKPVSVTIQTSKPAKQTLRINEIPVQEAQFRGKFFGNRTMCIETTQPDQDFRYWQIKTSYTDQPDRYEISTDPTLHLQVDTCAQQYEIQAVLGSDMPLLRYEEGFLEILSNIDNENFEQVQTAIAPLLESTTAVDLTKIHYQADLPLDTLLAGANPNRLVYTQEELEGHHVICNGHATLIQLSDQFAFHCPMDFEADEIRVVKHLPDQQTTRSYVGLTLPFAFEADEMPDRWRILTLADTQLIPTDEMQANQPYLVRFGESGDSIRLVAQHKLISSTPQKLAVEGNGMTMWGSYSHQTIAEGYHISDEDTEQGATGRLFIQKANEDITPFDIYLEATERVLPEYFTIGAGTVENESITSSDLQVRAQQQGIVVISPIEQALFLYTADGKLFRQVHLAIGQNQISLPSGIYILRQEVVVVP
ncbi:MAG: CotH kinase family protein [Parabacteroides sp.]|nr:CotH kinase family protein [Parabacteroides sp.]